LSWARCHGRIATIPTARSCPYCTFLLMYSDPKITTDQMIA
jgi:hypothetical protein